MKNVFFSLKAYALRYKFSKKCVLPPYDLSNASLRAKLSYSKQLLSMKTQS